MKDIGRPFFCLPMKEPMNDPKSVKKYPQRFTCKLKEMPEIIKDQRTDGQMRIEKNRCLCSIRETLKKTNHLPLPFIAGIKFVHQKEDDIQYRDPEDECLHLNLSFHQSCTIVTNHEQKQTGYWSQSYGTSLQN